MRAIIIILILFIMFACGKRQSPLFIKQYQKKEITGTYHSNKYNKFLRFTETSYVYFEKESHLATWTCCDTISFGTWLIDGPNLINLSSSFNMGLVDVPCNIKEALNDNIDNQLCFKINGLIEKFHKKHTYNKRGVTYILSLYGKFWHKDIPFKDSSICIREEKKVEKIRISMVVNENFSGRQIGLKQFTSSIYLIRGEESNLFEINIPVGYDYLTYLRLKEDYIKIIDNKRLKWNGEIYIKK